MKHYSDFSVCLCAFDWQDTLEDFSTLVSDKTFNKLPYADWKYLWGIAKSPDLIETEVFWAHDDGCRVEMEMTFHFKDGTTKNYICANGDNSFGDFLYVTDVWDSISAKADAYAVSSLQDTINALASKYAEATPMTNCVSNSYNNNTNKNEESNIMKFNFDFGPVNSSTVRMSMYGLAVKNKAGTWVSYDAASGNIVDVDVFNFDGAKFLYKMPVAIKDIAAGDIVIHNGAPMFVLGVPVGGKTLTVVDTINGERKDIMLATSPFGFNFATKVVNFLGNLNSGASSDNPFGNLGLMLMLSEDGNGVKDMLPLMMMANGGSVDMSNPMMMWALMGNDSKSGNDNLLPLMLMMNANKSAAPAHECKCGGHCGENHGQN